MNTDKIIFQYIYNRKRQRVGVVTALINSAGKIGLGWSLCATNRGDFFNPDIALEIATGRAENFPHFKDRLPNSIANDWEKINERAMRYFKNAELSN